MKKVVSTILMQVVLVVFACGCVSTLPLKSSISENAMIEIKTNSSEAIRFQYSSNISDGIIKPYTKDKEKEVSGHIGFNHSENSTLEKMLNEFMSSKFAQLADDGKIEIKIALVDFWIEQYSIDSNGKKVLVALVGGETNIMCAAKAKIHVTTNLNGELQEKDISATSEEAYVAGVGTGTSTSNIYRGKDSLENTHARNIDNANNKILIILNRYLEEIGL